MWITLSLYSRRKKEEGRRKKEESPSAWLAQGKKRKKEEGRCNKIKVFCN
ncbi:MAG: hypothetical protein ACRCT1_03375 [Microcoleaceae cyanobacterium]